MELIEMLNKYWETHEAKTYPGENGKWFDENDDEDGRNLVEILLKELFIGSTWNLETKSELQKAGYRCWIGDGDSFGILVACITKDGKSLVIG